MIINSPISNKSKLWELKHLSKGFKNETLIRKNKEN